MRIKFYGCLVVVAICTIGLRTGAQIANSVVRDSQAISILTQSVVEAGGVASLKAVEDYSGEGVIVFYFTDSQIQGTALIQARGASQLRIDSKLPKGTTSFVADNGSGRLLEPDGVSREISSFNLHNVGTLLLPALRVATGLQDPKTSIQLIGTEAFDSQQEATRIRITPKMNPLTSNIKELDAFGRFDVLVSKSTHMIVSISETVYTGSALHPCTRELFFSDFTQSNGLNVPFKIAEAIEGQRTWSLSVTSLRVNSGLPESLFRP